MIKFTVGRWTIYLLNFDAIGCWAWGRSGYDCLWDEWCFGFWLHVERLSDWALGESAESEDA